MTQSRNVYPSNRTRRRARRAADVLAAAYGNPHHNNKSDPLDELIFIILSQMTTGPSFNRVFDRLKRACRPWDRLLLMQDSELKELIKDAGLSGQKVPRLKAIAQRIKADFGEVSLYSLHDLGDGEVMDYLMSLPGVGIKTAKCVMMYSLGRKVLPVDTHVYRIAKRLSLISDARTTYQVHDALEAVVPPDSRYSFHVNGVAHGRAICRELNPRCSECLLGSICSYPARTSSGNGRRGS